MSAYASETEVSLRLQSMETKHDLLRHIVAGWSAWPILRFSVSRDLQHLALDKGGSHLSKLQLLKEAARDVRRVMFVRTAAYVIKTFSSLHTERFNGCKKDVFIEDVFSASEYYKIEVLNSPSAYSDPIEYCIPRDISTTALTVFSEKMCRFPPPPGVIPVASALSECICHELGLQQYTAEVIAARLSSFVWTKRLYRWLLARIKPKCVMLLDSADYGITAAARELNLKVVEFQHGFTHRHSPANSWTATALPHKKTIPLPHCMLLYGEHWRRELSANGFWSDELRVVGSARIDRYRSQRSAGRNDLCRIVATTQGLETTRLVHFLAEFVQLARQRFAFELFIKLHPAYATDQRTFIHAFKRCRNVQVIPGAVFPSTFELLQRAHLHVSIYSTCHYEALALGIPTAILPLPGNETVAHLFEAGHAFMPATPTELVDIASHWQHYRIPAKVGAEYFAVGAIKNIRRELTLLTE